MELMHKNRSISKKIDTLISGINSIIHNPLKYTPLTIIIRENNIKKKRISFIFFLRNQLVLLKI